ncbi:ImmA/IrrE family metallo-endopeptidase [Larkinella sp.]|uniref:ImmA/IrrE family metallo-endopeptidase n=1 Tax=Larkinella sp. TaxID=2034517 RepID=UPI003BAC8943
MQEHLLSEIYQLLETDNPVSFRELVEQRKNEMGITSNRQLSKLIGIDQTRLDRMLDGDTLKVDLFSFVKLDEFLGIGIKKLVQVYVSSLKPEFIGELERTRKASYIIRNFDLAGLKNQGFIDSISNFEAIEKRLTGFFKLDSILHYEREIGSVLFSRTKANSHDKMREFWVRSAYYQFERIENPNPYDRNALESLIPKIRPYTRYEEKGFLTVIQALYNIGITVIVQKYLSKTQVRGGTFSVKNKPCIVITDFNKAYPTLWFALMHELFHVLFDFEDLQKGMRFHLTGESDLLLFREEDADYFAREILFPQEKLDYIKTQINTPGIVAAYAEKNRVHPGIIYAFFCYHEKKHRNKDLYAIFQQYFGKSDKALQAVRTNPWDKETIYQEIELIKKKLATP